MRIGIIGLGNIGRIHCRHLLSTPGVRISMIADQSGVPDEFGAEIRRSGDWRAVVEDDAVDAVVISLPHSLHAECAEAAMRNGKDVFLEKPLATSLADARRLVNCAGELGRILMVNMTHRFYPPVRRARELLRQGAIGQVISVRDYYMEIIDRQEFPGWFFDPVLAGGGVALTDSIHLLDRVAWLLDEPLNFVGGAGRRLAPDTAVEDCAEILCSSSSGIPTTIGSFFFSGPKCWSDGLSLFGTKGAMTVHAWSHVEWHAYGEAPWREDGYPAELAQAQRPLEGHRAAIREFIDALREGRSPEAEARTALNAQEVLDRFYQLAPPFAQ